MCNSRHQNKAETCSDLSPSPSIRNVRKLIPGLCHSFSKLLEALTGMLPAPKRATEREQRKSSPQAHLSLRAGVSHANSHFLWEPGTQGSPWPGPALVGAVQKELRSPGTPHPTLSLCRNKAQYETETVEAVQFVNAALQSPPCRSPQPPRWAGAGTRCLSPPTPRAAAGQDTRVSTGHSSFSGSPAKPLSPTPRRSPGSGEAVQPGRKALRPGEEQPCRGHAHLVVLVFPLQAASQRGEDEAMTSVGPTTSRGLLCAAQPLTYDTETQGVPGHPAPGTTLASNRPSAGHPRSKPLRTASSRTPLLGHRVPFPGSSSPKPRSAGPHSPGTQ